MQINRLFETIYILLNKKTVTAKELSEHFEVSVRTIYRDMDILSAAGVPVYASKGKGGGISLIDNFVLNKSMLSEQEQNDILISLQSLNAADFLNVEPVLNKLSLFFNKQGANWIDVDFSNWGNDEREKEKFNILKSSILGRKTVFFDYYSSYSEKTARTVEPMKLLFKGRSWYLYGYCRVKEDYRVFKITRIKNLCKQSESFNRDVPDNIWGYSKEYEFHKVKLKLKIDERMAYRIFDEFDHEHINRNEDGSFTVTGTFPEDEWIYSHIMSYGNYAEVLEPVYIRDIIRKKYEIGFEKYKSL